MSSRRQRSIPFGGRYRQVSLYFFFFDRGFTVIWCGFVWNIKSLEWFLLCAFLSYEERFRAPSQYPKRNGFVFRIVRSLWNLTGTSAAMLPMCLSNFKAIRQFKVPISWLRDFTRSYEKTSFWILRRGPDSNWFLQAVFKTHVKKISRPCCET